MTIRRRFIARLRERYSDGSTLVNFWLDGRVIVPKPLPWWLRWINWID